MLAPRYPVFSCAVVIRGESALFRLPDRALRVAAPAGVLAKLAARCDGETSYADLARDLAKRWRLADVERFLGALAAHGALVDVDGAVLASWPMLENPKRAGGAIEPRELRKLLDAAAGEVAARGARGFRKPVKLGIGRLLEKRRSSRSFAAHRGVPLPKVRALLWAAYGAQAARMSDAAGGVHRTVPSGGGLFPLEIHLVNLRALPGLARGAYRARFRADGAVKLGRVGAAADDLPRTYADPGVLIGAQGVIVVSGRFGRSARKYGNRSALYVPLEAGHAAQNAALAAAEMRLAAVEIGGFIDERMRTLLRSRRGVSPLTTIVFGAPGAAPREAGGAAPEVDFNWVDLDGDGIAPAFHLGCARFTGGRGENVVCWGRDARPARAYEKAVAELWERRACRQPAGVYAARPDEIEAALERRSVVAYLASQYRYRSFPYSPRAGRGPRLWKDGFDYESRRRVPVPAELVYFRRALEKWRGGRVCTAATTSGVAAHTDAETAMRRATLELIERDAFMTAWLSGVALPGVRAESLPAAIRRRVAALRGLGVRIAIKDLSGPLAPVVFAFAQHESRAFTSVASHADFDPGAALEHALTELESLVFMRLLGAEVRAIAPAQVRDPEDHADLYAQRRYFRRADRLARRGPAISFGRLGRRSARTWSGLRERLRGLGRRLIGVDLSPAGARIGAGGPPLRVVRAIIPGLIPMSFGFGTEPLALPAVQSLLRRSKIDSLSRGKRVLFPHPFA